MRSLSLAARLSLIVMLSLVVFCLGLSVYQYATGRLGYLYLTAASESPEGYPRVLSIGSRHDRSELQVGDVLLRAGEQSLQGTGAFSFYATVLEAAPADQLVPIEFERDGVRGTATLDVSPRSGVRPFKGFLCALFFVPLSTLILLRAPRDRRSLLIFFNGTLFTLNQLVFPGGAREISYLWFGTATLSQAFQVTMLLTWIVWPARRPLGRALAWPCVFLVTIYLGAARVHALWPPAPTASTAFFVMGALFMASNLTCSVIAYRASDALARRQMKWVLLGCVVALLPNVGMNVVVGVQPDLLPWRNWLQLWGILVIPLAMFMAIVRYELFDINRLITATTSYSLLGIALIAGLLTVVPRIAEAATTALGVPPSVSQGFVSLALAAVIVPGHRILRPRIERWFFKERRELQQGIDRLLFDLSGCEDPEALTERMGTGLEALLHPDVCAIYTRAGQAYGPVFAAGRGVPPAVSAGSPVIAALESASAPVRTATWLRRGSPVVLAASDRAVLETLGAPVLVPVLHRGVAVSFVCLGTKRSGDIYTSTDLALLGQVAQRASRELRRFDDADIIRQGREMQASLRRYVPGAVAEEISSGKSLEGGEREVSVLFVDMRGYTAMSEGRQAHEVFSTINRYTDAVSRVVRAHGGSVVEFNGDGMMAVFGAPRELPCKERSAVEAAREMSREVAKLAPEGGDAEGANLSVGVGVATGPAYVGNIQAVDRMIWSAIGNTTNLAARLEGLTRTLDAQVVIDDATYRGAGDAAADFSAEPGYVVRGKQEPQDLYLLPL